MFIVSGNVAYHKSASQADLSGWAKRWPASRAVDGNTNPNMAHGHCAHPESDPGGRAWWMVDLVDTYNISKVTIYNRADTRENECWDIYIMYLHNIFNNETSSGSLIWLNFRSLDDS